MLRNVKVTNMKIDKVIDQYIKLILPRKPKSAPTDLIMLNWWRSTLPKDISITDITAKDIIECRNKLIKTINKNRVFNSNATINRHCAVLSHLYTIAINEWELINISPFKKIKKLKEPAGRTRYLTDDERIRLLGECENYRRQPLLYPIVLLLLTTGARRSEILTLRWSQVDLNRKIIVLNDTKNGSCRTLFLTEQCISLLSDLLTKSKHKGKYEYSKVREDSLLFQSNTNNTVPVCIRRPWLQVIKRAQIYNFKLHDLRHTSASYLAMSGASLLDIATILGHKDLSVTMRYSHLNTNHISTIMTKMTNSVGL